VRRLGCVYSVLWDMVVTLITVNHLCVNSSKTRKVAIISLICEAAGEHDWEGQWGN
jgi:hypothetical protein